MPLVVMPLVVQVTPVPIAAGAHRRPRRGRNVRQAPGLSLGAQPVHVGQDLAAQLPAFRLFGRVGGEQVSELVLLPLGLLEVIFQRLCDRLGRVGGEVGGHRVSLKQLAVGPDRGGKLGDHGGQPGAGVGFPDRAVVAVEACAVRHRTRQHPHVRRRPLQRVDAVPQACCWVAGRSLLGFSRTLSSAWASASSTRSISPRSARVRSSHSAARRGSGTSASPSAIWPSRSAIWRLSSPSASLARLHPQRSEHQARRQSRGGADQRLGDAAGGGGVRVDREDHHGAIGTSRISSRSRSTMPSTRVPAMSRPSTHQLNGT